MDRDEEDGRPPAPGESWGTGGDRAGAAPRSVPPPRAQLRRTQLRRALLRRTLLRQTLRRQTLRRQTLLRPALAAVLGAATGAWVDGLAGPVEPRAPGPPRVWVADRAGGAVHAVDGDGIVVRTARVPRPLRVAARKDGGVLVTADAEPLPLEVALDAEGRVRSIRAAPRSFGGREPSAGAAIDRARWRTRPARGPKATYVDRVVRGEPGHAAATRLAFRIRVPFDVALLAPDPAGGVWCVGRRTLRVVHVGPDGTRSRVASWPDAEGAAAACVGGPAPGGDRVDVDSARGTLWVATPGALVRIALRRSARAEPVRLPGQGGFHRLVDVSAVATSPHSIAGAEAKLRARSPSR